MSLFIETLENRQFFVATGLPDTSFGGSTSVGTVAFRSDTAHAAAAPVKLLVDSGGRSYVVASVPGILEVRRLTREGVLDTTYANARGLIGLPVETTLTGGTAVGGVTAAMDVADRLYLLAGDKVYRFTVSGKIDPTFGTKGVATLSGFSGARDIAVDSHNRIYVSGSVAIGSGTSAAQQFRVARLRSNGTFDKTFGSSGVYTVALPKPAIQSTGVGAQGQFIRVLADDSVVAVASTRATATDGAPRANQTLTGVEAVRFTADSTLDTTYGVSGVAQQIVGGDDVNYRNSGAAGIRSDGSVVTYTASQSADSDYSSSANQLITANGSVAHTYRVDSADASVVVTRGTFTNAPGGGELIDDAFNGNLYRTKSDGTIDATFTGTGTTVPIGRVGAVAVSADGTILTVGASSKALSLNVRRLFASATPVANLAAKPVTASGSATFSVTYASPAGFSSSAGDGSEISVLKGSTTLHPSVVSRTVVNDSLVVRYRLSDGGSPFAAADNGSYVVKLLAGEIQDSASIAAAARTLGSLTVAIA